MSDELEITVEDWDAAQVYADLYSGSECYKPSYHQRIGEAFARHRIAAEQRGKMEGARLAIEAAAGECVEYEAWHNKHDDGLSGFGHMALGASEVRDAIRALSPAKIVGQG